MNSISTHVLDTAKGKPAEGLKIQLKKMGANNSWPIIAEGITNSDGRIKDFLSADYNLELGSYQMFFETGTYFKQNGLQIFYPEVSIHFNIFEAGHYHIPLLLSPFGYSTYRGS